MAVSQDDAAYSFVKEANLTEERNALRRQMRHEKRWRGHPVWFLVTGPMFAVLSVIEYRDADYVISIIFGIVAVFHLQLAYQLWQSRKKAGSGP